MVCTTAGFDTLTKNAIKIANKKMNIKNA